MIILWEDPDNAFIGITYDNKLKAHQMHVDCIKWTPSYLKKYLKAIKKVKETLKDSGIEFVYGLCESEKELKFNKVFGAIQVDNHVAFDNDGGKNYITILET
jgi:hypothetical protein